MDETNFVLKFWKKKNQNPKLKKKRNEGNTIPLISSLMMLSSLQVAPRAHSD